MHDEQRLAILSLLQSSAKFKCIAQRRMLVSVEHDGHGVGGDVATVPDLSVPGGARLLLHHEHRAGLWDAAALRDDRPDLGAILVLNEIEVDVAPRLDYPGFR